MPASNDLWCEKCIYWRRLNALELNDKEKSEYERYVSGDKLAMRDIVFGECKRMPPTLLAPAVAGAMRSLGVVESIQESVPQLALMAGTVSPVTSNADWCGEWDDGSTSRRRHK